MKIRFVSHASFSVESRGTTLLCDPWLFGKAFNNGWALLSPAAEVSWPDIDYVWISHQHPDHLHFPTLKSLPLEQRHRLKMLYQKHASMRIPKVLEGMGYADVRELPLDRWIPLQNGMEVICGSVGSMDSWIAMRAEGITVLNLNDCIISRRHLEHIAKLVGRPTVLLTQFSFANWIGNHKDELGAAQHKLDDVRFRVNFLKPDFTIPFASFIYFCNRENCWMNDFAVTPRRVAGMELPGMNFMYPGDVWDSEVRTFRSPEAVEQYMKDIARPKSIDPTPGPIAMPILEHTVNRMLRMVRARFGKFLIGRIAPFSVYLHDVDKILVVNPASVCQVLDATDQAREAARFVMCSQVAWYGFAYTWGWGAMEVSGMYFDRRWQEPCPLAFYLNALSTEFLDFRGVRQSLRTLEFMWGKRHELAARVLSRFFPEKRSTRGGEAGAAEEAMATVHSGDRPAA